MYMAKEYPYLAFTFKGRIKSLIRAEAKFNGYIVKDIYKYYIEHGTYPPVEEVKKRLQRFGISLHTGSLFPCPDAIWKVKKRGKRRN